MVALIAFVFGTAMAGTGGTNAAGPASTTAAVTRSLARWPAGDAAEATAAIDPADPQRIAVAADPYLSPTRIQVWTSMNGGATWSRPVTLLPEGTSKSYDPQLAWSAEGSLLVSGGAAADGRQGCLSGSIVFIAELLPGAGPTAVATTRVVARAAAGQLLDRPGLAVSARTGRVGVSWTSSSGAGAVCRPVPLSSSLYARVGTGDRFSAPLRLNAAGTAPYGSQLAALTDGSFVVATVDRARRVAVLRVLAITPDGRRSTLLHAEGTGSVAPLRLGGLSGLSLAVPAIAVSGPRIVVAVVGRNVAGVQGTVLLASADGGRTWRAQPGPGGGGAVVTFGVAIAPDGRTALAEARVQGRGLRFRATVLTGSRWGTSQLVGVADASRYVELGENVGTALDGSRRVLVAVPLNTAGAGELVLAWLPLPALPTPAATAGGRRGPAERPDGARSVNPGAGLRAPVGLALLAIGAAVALLGARRRQVRRARARRAAARAFPRRPGAPG